MIVRSLFYENFVKSVVSLFYSDEIPFHAKWPEKLAVANFSGHFL